MDRGQSDNKSMTFLEHLEELRGCILRALAGVVLGFLAAYYFSDRIYDLLLAPFTEAYRHVLRRDPILIFTSPFEMFFAYIKVGLVAGLFVASPYVFYEIYRFIAPGLYRKEKRLVVPFVSMAVVFFVGGALFGYFLVFPTVFKFFLGYATDVIQPLIKVSDYLTISLGFLLIFGAVFEFPLIVLFLVYIRVLSSSTLYRKWRFILVGIAIASAIFTPADALSMMLMMVPLTVLYLITIVGALIIEHLPGRA